MNKIEIRDPQDLRLHPLQKKYIAEPDKDAPEWLSFVDGLSAAGVEGIPPIFVTHDGQIMEGGRRWRAAKQLGWPELQCQVRPAEDAAAIIVESLLGQRNLQRCVKVYIAITLLEEFVESAEHRRLLHLRNKVKTLEKPLISNLSKPESQRALAEKFGVSQPTILQAQRVQELFHNPDCKELLKFWSKPSSPKPPSIEVLRVEQKRWREMLEPQLLSGEKNLWNVISHIGGDLPGNQNQRDTSAAQSTFEFYETLFAPISENAANYHWKQIPQERREEIVTKWTAEAKTWKPELRAAILEAIQNA